MGLLLWTAGKQNPSGFAFLPRPSGPACPWVQRLQGPSHFHVRYFAGLALHSLAGDVIWAPTAQAAPFSGPLVARQSRSLTLHAWQRARLRARGCSGRCARPQRPQLRPAPPGPQTAPQARGRGVAAQGEATVRPQGGGGPQARRTVRCGASRARAAARCSGAPSTRAGAHGFTQHSHNRARR